MNKTHDSDFHLHTLLSMLINICFELQASLQHHEHVVLSLRNKTTKDEKIKMNEENE